MKRKALNIAIAKTLLIFLAAAVALAACSGGGGAGNSEDARKFKHEHEVMNGQTTPDGEHTYKPLDIPEKNPFVYVDAEGAKAILASGSGIVYMGFPECPWCRTLLPALIDALRESKYKGKVYYYNGLADRDVRKLGDDGVIVVEQEGLPAYHEMVGMLYDRLGPYKGLNDDSIRRIYFPTTVFVKNGVVKSVHLTTVDSQESGYDALTDEQYGELKNALIEKIKGM